MRRMLLNFCVFVGFHEFLPVINGSELKIFKISPSSFFHFIRHSLGNCGKLKTSIFTKKKRAHPPHNRAAEYFIMKRIEVGKSSYRFNLLDYIQQPPSEFPFYDSTFYQNLNSFAKVSNFLCD